MSTKLEPAIIVKDVKKNFRIPLDKTSGIKQLVVNFFKRKKGYREFEALKGVSLEINKGEFFGIVGRNGSGKSTLLKILAGIYSPDSGGVAVNGSLTPFIELGVGFNPELSGRENVYLNGALLGFSRDEIKEMYDEIVDFAELHDFMEERLKNYSSGMQVRLAFSIAVRARTDILVLDEVLAVGDESFQQKCFQYFERVKQEGRTVIIVTHDMTSVRRFCTRAVYIEDGRQIKDGTPFEIAKIYNEKNITLDHTQAIGLSSKHNLETKISKSSENKTNVVFSYTTSDTNPMFVGLSVLKDGISVAEITTPTSKPLKGSGRIEYVLDESAFNEGVYQITTALFLVKNRQLVAVGSAKTKVVIEGQDITRAGALKLADTWKYSKETK